MARLIAVFLLLSLVPALAAAQEAVELSETQRGYNEKGVAAIRNGNYAVAISSFESSLAFGEANITYLNLGRAYQRAGQCKPAKDAYAKVADAPPVPAPSKDEVDAVLTKYRAELPALCPATLEVMCGAADTRVSLDTGESEPCGAMLTREVTPGTHTIHATLGPQTVKREVTPTEGDTVRVVIEFPALTSSVPNTVEPTEAADADAVIVAPRTPAPSPLRTVGVVVGAVGAAALTTGLILDATYVKSTVRPCTPDALAGEACDDAQHSSAQTARAVNMTVLSVGGGLAVAGAILYLAGGSSDSGLSLQLGTGPGIAFTKRF